MAGEKDRTNNFSELWKRQKEESMEITMDSIRKDARKFERDIRDRNFFFWVFSGAGVVLFWIAVSEIEAHFLMRLGFAGIALPALFLGVYLIKKGGNKKTVDSDITTTQFLETYRDNMEYQEILTRNTAIGLVCSLSISYPLIVTGLILDAIANGKSMVLPIALGCSGVVDIIATPIVILWLASTFRKKREKIRSGNLK